MITKYPLFSFTFLLILVVNFLLAPLTHAATGLPPVKDTAYKGTFVSQSVPDPIQLEPGQTKIVEVTYKNSGTATWKKDGKNYVSVYTVIPSVHDSQFASKAWLNPGQPARLAADVAPGGKVTFKIPLTAPDRPGNYQEDFYLAAENKTWIKGTHFYFKINVAASADPVVVVEAATLSEVEPVIELVASTTPRELITEPNIRVGLLKTTEAVTFSSDFAYDVYSGAETAGVLLPGDVATLEYREGVYSFTSSNLEFTGDKAIRIVAATPESYFTLPSVTRTLSGHNGRNYNSYRGSFEYRYSAISKIPYLINELPLEDYVGGIGETGNGMPPEYTKALITAARTYGYVGRSGKVPSDTNVFDVYATTQDQLYLGYNFEKVATEVKAAAEATRGEMVTYKGNPVVTYYFSHSDGKTRNGKASMPWLKSVPAVYDKGLSMLGHGIGMSNRDAIQRARKDGWFYDEILKYYYSGTKVEKIY